MTLDYKGFTEEEIQEQIDWKLSMKQIDEQMWKMHAQDIIRKIIMDVMNKDLISTDSAPPKEKNEPVTTK